LHTHRPHRRTLALAATAALGSAAVVAGTSSAQTTQAHAAGTTVHVIEHAITDTEIPTGGGKDVKGNILTFNNPVYNVANKKQVGHDEGFCTRIAPCPGNPSCFPDAPWRKYGSVAPSGVSAEPSASRQCPILTA